MQRVSAIKKTLVASEQKRDDVVEARTAWTAMQSTLDPARLVFIDETWASTAMTRRYGRAPIGERLIGYAPNGHWKTTTFLAALRVDGLTAPAVFDGPIDGESFQAYVDKVLVPTLKPNDMVMMDNLPVHKVYGVREAIEAAGATRILLPSYSPDLNPIEQVFAKIKAWLRTQAARSVDALWNAIGHALKLFSPDECARYLANSGYHQPIREML